MKSTVRTLCVQTSMCLCVYFMLTYMCMCLTYVHTFKHPCVCVYFMHAYLRTCVCVLHIFKHLCVCVCMLPWEEAECLVTPVIMRLTSTGVCLDVVLLHRGCVLTTAIMTGNHMLCCDKASMILPTNNP